MLAFTSSTIPLISQSVDFLSIMTYDLMNRRDSITKHHAGVKLADESITAYTSAGLEPEKANIGFAFYVKWFKTTECVKGEEIGCETELMEDPITGGDLGKAGAFSWHDAVPEELKASFSKAIQQAKWDGEGGGNYYWDEEERIWWSWDGKESIQGKCDIIKKRGLGGAFAWALGEDGTKFSHLKLLNEEVEKLKEAKREEGMLRDEL